MAFPKFTVKMKDEFITKFIDNNFALNLTCDEIGISKTSYYDAIKKDKGFKDRLDLYKNEAKSIIEIALLKGVTDIDPAISVKFLDLIGKHKSFQTIFKIENKDENDTLIFELKKSDLID